MSPPELISRMETLAAQVRASEVAGDVSVELTVSSVDLLAAYPDAKRCTYVYKYDPARHPRNSAPKACDAIKVTVDGVDFNLASWRPATEEEVERVGAEGRPCDYKATTIGSTV